MGSSEAKPVDRLSQLRRADDPATGQGVEALRRNRDATSFGSGEFRLQGLSPDKVAVTTDNGAT